MISNKILNEMCSLKEYIDKLNDLHKFDHTEYNDLLDSTLKELKKYREIIEKQDETIQTLMGNWKDNKEFECVTFVPYRGKPVVIKDGKVVSNENMTSFDVGWAWDSKTEVTVNNE